MSKPWTDIFNEFGKADTLPHVNMDGPNDKGVYEGPTFPNAFDPNFSLDQWQTQKLQMTIAEEDVEPLTCEEDCKEKTRKANEKCTVIRKRVQEALNKAGCPSKVVALKRKGGCGSSKKKDSKPKATTPVASRRGR